MSEQQKQRQCEECKQLLPLIPENFPRVSGTDHNYEFICRPCKRALKDKAKVAELESKAVETFLGSTSQGGSSIPHTAEMLEAIMKNVGGVNGFAGLCMKQYFDAKPGSRLRNSLLETIVRLTTKNTEHGGARKPVSLLTEEELEEEINKRLQHAVEGRRIIDAHSVDAGSVYLPDGRDSGAYCRIEREEGGSSEAIPPDAAAESLPRFDGERDSGSWGE